MTGIPTILIVGLCVVTTGCATMTSGTTDVITISSVPDGATVEVEGRTYQTPIILTLSRSKSYEVVIRKEGYLPAHRVISRVGNAASGGNLLAGGIVGIVTDQSTGAAFRLVPTDLKAELVPVGSADEKIYERRQ